MDFGNEWREPRRLWLLYAVSILKGIGFTIIFTTSSDYVASFDLPPGLVGLLLGLVPLGSGLTAFLFQYLCKKLGFKFTFVLMALLGVCGGFLYAICFWIYQTKPALSDFAITLLFLSRFLLGASGSSAILVEYLGITVGKKRKTVVMNCLLGYTNMGFGLGPLLASMISYLFRDQIDPVDSDTIGLLFNNYTTPGWVITASYIVMAFLWGICFNDVSRRDIEEFTNFTEPILSKDETSLDLEEKDETASTWRDDFVLFGALLTSGLTVGFGLSSLEARTVFVAQSTWNWSESISAVYVGLAFLAFSFFAMLLMPTLKSKWKVPNTKMVLLCFGSVAVLSILFYDFGNEIVQIVLWSCGFLFFGSVITIGRSSLFALGLNSCSNEFVPLFSTLLNLTNSIGRGLGPAVASLIGEGYMDANTYSSVLLGIFVFNTIMIAILYPHLNKRSGI